MARAVVDGSRLEGGGQVLRLSAALCALQRRDLRVENIRGGRSRPGLQHQHCAALRMVARASGADLEGCDIGSRAATLTFPDQSKDQVLPQRIVDDACTAGSTTLMLQAVLPVAVARSGETTFVMRGGTNTLNAPGFDHVHLALGPILDQMGIHVKTFMAPRGFFPEGGGEMTARVTCDEGGVKPVDFGAPTATVEYVTGVIFGRYLSRDAAMHLAEETTQALQDHFDCADVKIDDQCTWDENDIHVLARSAKGKRVVEPKRSHFNKTVKGIPRSPKRIAAKRPTFGIQLAAVTSSGSRVATDRLVEHADDFSTWKAACTKAVMQLVHDTKVVGAGVDEQTADQLVPFMALADGPSRLRCPARVKSQHLATVIELAAEFTGATFAVRDEGASKLIECSGSSVLRDMPLEPPAYRRKKLHKTNPRQQLPKPRRAAPATAATLLSSSSSSSSSPDATQEDDDGPVVDAVHHHMSR